MFFHAEQSDEVFIKFQTFHVAVVWKGCFIGQCTDMCKDRFGVQLLQNLPLCRSTCSSLPLNLFHDCRSMDPAVITAHPSRFTISPLTQQSWGPPPLYFLLLCGNSYQKHPWVNRKSEGSFTRLQERTGKNLHIRLDVYLSFLFQGPSIKLEPHARCDKITETYEICFLVLFWYKLIYAAKPKVMSDSIYLTW